MGKLKSLSLPLVLQSMYPVPKIKMAYHYIEITLARLKLTHRRLLWVFNLTSVVPETFQVT